MNSELPNPAAFAEATGHVRPEDIAEAIPCDSDTKRFVEAVKPYIEAGFTEIALIQIGGDHQEPFLDWSQKTLLPALRAL